MSETNLSTRPETIDSASVEPTATERKRILLVEGDGFTRLVLLLRLRLAGFGVDFTSNGILGRGKLRTCHPDILLVELKLCGLSGLDLVKAARAEPTFGNRPIYVFTRADRMHRSARKELEQLGTTVIDKTSVTREDLVQIFSTTFLNQEPAGEKLPANAGKQSAPPVISQVVVSGAIQALIAGVRDQSEVFVGETGPRAASGGELLSRVSSLGSCAKAASLPNLARHAKALENFLKQLCQSEQTCSDTALSTVTRAVEVMSQMSLETTGKQQNPTGFSVVFVDEAPYSNRAMEEALLKAGFGPFCFEDPGQAREYLASNKTELIVANMVLPEGHGLALADIRKLSLHAKTPVLFGPDSAPKSSAREESPTGATRLDKAPLLLAELVVRALNEVQGKNIFAPVRSMSAVPASGTAGQSLARQNAAASLPGEDDFELFAQTPKQEAAALDLSAQSESVPAEETHRHRPFNHLFAAGSMISEPVLRAVPGAPEVDNEAESLQRLPETTIDGSQIDEQPVEELPPVALHAEVEQPPQPEPSSTEQTTEEAWPPPASSDAGQFIPEQSDPSELEQNQAAAVQESTTNYTEVMNTQLQAAPADTSHESQPGQPGEALNGHQNLREELATRVCAAEMALYHAQMDIQQRDQAIEALHKQLAQAKAGQSQAEPGSSADTSDGAAERKAQARCAELEEEIAALRQAFDGLNSGFGEQQQASSDASKQLQELEQRLSQNAAELEKQKEQQRCLEAELRVQLEAAKAASEKSEAALQQGEARRAELEQELAAARRASAESSDKSPGAEASALEQQVRQGVAALAHATADLAKERGERQRSQQLAADLNGRLKALHEDFSRTLQAQGEHLSHINTLEQQHQQTSQALARCTADLEQQQAERRLADEQLQKAKEACAQLRGDLSFFEASNDKFNGARQELQTKLEAGLNAAREKEARLQQENAERQRLADRLEEARRELQNQSRRREALEQELQSARNELQDREASLQKEIAERQRLNAAQGSLQHGLEDRSERDLELSKLQSALQTEQVERKRQESQLARTRQSALDAAHAARALRTSLRRQIREPIDNLIHSAHGLLELEMGEEQKKLAEAVLQDVLLVQTRLREPVPTHEDATETPVTPAPTAT